MDLILNDPSFWKIDKFNFISQIHYCVYYMKKNKHRVGMAKWLACPPLMW